MHLELTNGQSAELRDPATVTRKERNALMEGMPTAPRTLGPDGKFRAGDIDFKTSIASTDMLIAFIVESWTLDLPLPSENREVLDDLMAIDAGLLENAANDFLSVLLPDVDVDPTRAASTT